MGSQEQHDSKRLCTDGRTEAGIGIATCGMALESGCLGSCGKDGEHAFRHDRLLVAVDIYNLEKIIDEFHTHCFLI